MNAILLGKYEGSYYRAKVTKVVDGMANVHFVDFGNETLVGLSDLRTLSKNLRAIPPAVVSVTLKGVPLRPYITIKEIFDKVINMREPFILVSESTSNKYWFSLFRLLLEFNCQL